MDLMALNLALCTDVIDDWEYVILLQKERIERPVVPRVSFDLDKLDEMQCLKKFRFRREHLGDLVILLKFPDVIILDNGC